jgi:hypothetical protein
MKKKNLKSLALRKRSVSNLALLYLKTGGMPTNEGDAGTTTNIYIGLSKDTECTDHNVTELYRCNLPYTYDGCQTSTATTVAQPPTEYEGCVFADSGNIF